MIVLLLQLEKIKTQDELREKAQENGVVRAGAIDLQRRKEELQSEGFSGTMYYTDVKNMRLAENNLLACKSKFSHNPPKEGDAADESGYIYVIQGRKSTTN